MKVRRQADGATDHQAKTPPGDNRGRLPPYETIALVLQGGGALGAYQAGVFEGLHEADIPLGWIAGISIGALNAAIIAGNAFEHALFNGSEATRTALSFLQASSAAIQGQSGFFHPRFPIPMPWLEGPSAANSWYDMSPLKATLERFCDFDRINAGETRVSVGAVNVATGNFSYFDNTRIALRAEHFMASGALPPAFAPVEIDGEFFWDGGIVSNTPLQEVLRASPRRDTLVFQVDLWSARGSIPNNLANVAERTKDIQYSSRTRFVTDALQGEQRYRTVLRKVLERVPEALRKDDPWFNLAAELSCGKRYNVQHLIYRQQKFEHDYKDYQFGSSTMNKHWAEGLSDIRRTLANRSWLELPDSDAGFITHDIHRTKPKAKPGSSA
ncbi:patatin-like phospholipase family protein [Dyella silvatica]|uniref:patatin-like phospholipase family protein n=1 Tax=Dyella silvatica TaxID=2992128 RepID=UPI00225221A8|nr:patatin-like phospholipase family protein [Dyella silvatica]